MGCVTSRSLPQEVMVIRDPWVVHCCHGLCNSCPAMCKQQVHAKHMQGLTAISALMAPRKMPSCMALKFEPPPETKTASLAGSLSPMLGKSARLGWLSLAVQLCLRVVPDRCLLIRPPRLRVWTAGSFAKCGTNCLRDVSCVIDVRCVFRFPY